MSAGIYCITDKPAGIYCITDKPAGIYWFDSDPKETPTYKPTILFNRGFSEVYLKNPCCVCRQKMRVKDSTRVVLEMIENGWCHPGPGTIVCNKESCRNSIKN